ncbi:MerC domain-containing protein [Halobacteriovorax sp.]|uniref:MerC domain-containing protein n=1 Tax=Halobacteriovorax sp. TaxID=2020862 RepID=UPI00356164B7
MQNELSFVVLKKVDQTGIICSGACAIHCLLFPILAFASPAISNYLNNEWIHVTLVIALIPIAFFSFSRSIAIHGDKKPIVLGSAGILFLVSAIAVESLHIEIAGLEKSLTAIGSILLIAAHIFNIKGIKQS